MRYGLRSGMDRISQKHWGDWINARAAHVGITRKGDLAGIVGCRREQVSRWIAMAVPPVHLRKGFDHKLAYALQTTREMLLKGWQSTPAEKAERVTLHADQLPLVEEDSWNPALADLWRKIIPYLAPAELEWLLLQAALKVLEKRDARAEIFRPILDRFKIFEHYVKTGERLPAPPPEKSQAPPVSLSEPMLGENLAAYSRRVQDETAKLYAIADGLSAIPSPHPPTTPAQDYPPAVDYIGPLPPGSILVTGHGTFRIPPDPPAPPSVKTIGKRTMPPRKSAPKKPG
jgi:hypothetical protein